MKALKQFSIPFTGLKLGKHQFDFEIDKSFFAMAPNSLPRKIDDDATIVISETQSVLTELRDQTASEIVTHASFNEREAATKTEIDYGLHDFHGDHLKLKTKKGKMERLRRRN